MKFLKGRKNSYYSDKPKTGEIPLKDGNKNTIVEWLVETHLVEWYVTYLLKKPIEAEDVQDKIQEIYLMILEMPQEKWDSIYEQGQVSVSGYVTGIVHQQVISDSSDIYKKYNKHHQKEKRMGEEFWKLYYNDGMQEEN